MTDFETRFVAARRAVIDMDLEKLNKAQREAAEATEGPLLILAGAGSGKTTVLIHRIACILKYGRAADSTELPPDAAEEDLALLERYVRFRSPEDKAEAERLCALEPAQPWQIIAITFTNKAAGELVARLEKMLGARAGDVWASTFHSACVRILRRNVQELGLFSRDFTIYDTADSLSLIKRILKDMELDEKKFAPRSLLSAISNAKDNMQTPADCLASAGADLWRKTVAQVYGEYSKRMLRADAMDFDDLILHTVSLLEKSEEARTYYQRKFRYVLVDEYQDTSMLQYRLVRLLAGGFRNVCVVGDDDQGIYRFRGATIRNILEFEAEYKGARVVKLEQNYRSTGVILDAANEVIRQNQGRKGKTLWTANGRGDPVTLYTAQNENDEAQYIAERMVAGYGAGARWHDFAVLYRINAMSNRLEYAMKRNGIPYRIYGGMRFYDRAEIKDMLAYLCVVANPEDELRLRRVVNNPPRGVGDTTVERASAIAAGEGKSLYRVLQDAAAYPELRRSLAGIQSFVSAIEETRAKREEPLDEVYEFLLRRSGYLAALEAKDSQENITRAENVRELQTNIISFLKERGGVGTLEDFLDEMALYSDSDTAGDEDAVSLMTMHSAKGLEFETVFVAGAEDGLFPGSRALGEPEELEEERRLCYVAITRARQKLYITNARQRMVFGRTQNNMVSRFVRDISDAYLEKLPPERQSRWEAAPGAAWEAPRRDAPAAPPRPKARPAAAAYAQKPAAPAESFRVGDAVAHKAFGAGVVVSVTAMGPDHILEISFEAAGTKRLMQSSAGRFLRKT